MSEPTKEYTQFAAGLSFIPALPPTEAAALLKERLRHLEEEIEGMQSRMDAAVEQGVALLYLIEYELVLREAELSCVRDLANEIAGGTLGGMREWESFHSRPAVTGAKQREKEGTG